MQEGDGGGEESVPGSLSGVSSDFEDSLLKRVAGSGSAPAAAASAGVPPIATELDGKYRLDRLLGRGGMGSVFAATHLTTGRQVAIKWMLRRGDVEQLRKRFVREARAAGRIRHPNVIDIHDVVSDERRTYLVMELLEGESLRARLNRERLEPREAVQIALAMLDGLREAHRQGVIHRDLKPENVFLCSSPPCIKLVDFGISVLAETRPVVETNLTRTGYFVGTPVYTALERLREKQPFDHRVDLYSVGVILYEALTGELPFSGRTPSELTYQLALSSPRPPRELCPDLAPALEAVVLRAMARDPAERFEDAQSLSDALRSALDAPVTRPRHPRARWAAAFAVTAALIGVAIAGTFRDGGPATAARREAAPPPRETLTLATQLAPPPAPRSNQVAIPSALPNPPAPPRKPVARPLQPRPSASAAAAAPPARSTGSAELSVVVFPYGDVWVDGRRVGSSPARLTLPPGVHVISGGRISGERETRVELAAGESRDLVLSWSKTKGESAPSAAPSSSVAPAE